MRCFTRTASGKHRGADLKRQWRGTHGLEGLMELVQPQHIHINRFAILPNAWWMPYTPTAVETYRGFAKYFATGSVLQTTRLLPQLWKPYQEPSSLALPRAMSMINADVYYRPGILANVVREFGKHQCKAPASTPQLLRPVSLVPGQRASIISAPGSSPG